MGGQTVKKVRNRAQTGNRVRRPRMKLAVALGLLATLAIAGCRGRYEDLDLAMYRYRDTRNLVKFVYDAARALTEEGLDGLSRFRSHREEFRTEDYYLYIYDPTGTNLFHAGMEELEGRNLWEVTDKDGKPVFQQVIDALEDENNPHAWVHYSWWEPDRFYPVPKASCHFQVETPEGEVLIVGGGLDYPHEEQEFIRIVVDDAVDLIERKGEEALSELADPTSIYSYRDVRVIVFRRDGEMLISPAINSTFSQTNLLECADEVGHKPFVQAIEALETADSVWEVFMAKSPYKRQLTRKSLYVRTATLLSEEIYVATITDLPEPPY
jgi:hypothetical protein